MTRQIASAVQLRRSVGKATSLLWAAGRLHTASWIALQVLAALGLAAELFVARQLFGLFSGDLQTVREAVPFVVAFAGLTAFAGAAAAVGELIRPVLSEKVADHVLGEILDVALAVELDAYEDPAFFNLLERTQTRTIDHAWDIVFALIRVSTGIVNLVVVGSVLFYTQPIVTALFGVSYGLVWLVGIKHGRNTYIWDYFQATPDRERNYLVGLMVSRRAAPEVRMFGLGPTLRERYRQIFRARLDGLEAVVRRSLWQTVGAHVAIGLATAGALLVMVNFALDGRLPVGDAGVLVLGMLYLRRSLNLLASVGGRLPESAKYLSDFEQFRSFAPTELDLLPSLPPFSTVDVNAVGFSYPGADRTVLEDVSCHIEAGQVIALVGENGSGKSTLAKLLAGLYRPTTGSICWDGRDLGEIAPPAVREHVSVVFQDHQRYEFTALDNVVFGNPSIPEDRGRASVAASVAGAEFIDGLPHGWASRLSREYEDGTEPSGGQWQRIAIARAVYKDAPFLILDEPTSSLDARAEAHLFRDIRKLAAGRTVVFVSHRLWTVQDADQILVLGDGRLVETGTHDELMGSDGHYAELFRLQAGPYVDAMNSESRPSSSAMTSTSRS